jgi:hypothetical protein
MRKRSRLNQLNDTSYELDDFFSSELDFQDPSSRVVNYSPEPLTNPPPALAPNPYTDPPREIQFDELDSNTDSSTIIGYYQQPNSAVYETIGTNDGLDNFIPSELDFQDPSSRVVNYSPEPLTNPPPALAPNPYTDRRERRREKKQTLISASIQNPSSREASHSLALVPTPPPALAPNHSTDLREIVPTPPPALAPKPSTDRRERRREKKQTFVSASIQDPSSRVVNYSQALLPTPPPALAPNPSTTIEQISIDSHQRQGKKLRFDNKSDEKPRKSNDEAVKIIYNETSQTCNSFV